jgi:hypothetical protein
MVTALRFTRLTREKRLYRVYREARPGRPTPDFEADSTFVLASDELAFAATRRASAASISLIAVAAGPKARLFALTLVFLTVRDASRVVPSSLLASRELRSCERHCRPEKCTEKPGNGSQARRAVAVENGSQQSPHAIGPNRTSRQATSNGPDGGQAALDPQTRLVTLSPDGTEASCDWWPVCMEATGGRSRATAGGPQSVDPKTKRTASASSRRPSPRRTHNSRPWGVPDVHAMASAERLHHVRRAPPRPHAPSP